MFTFGGTTLAMCVLAIPVYIYGKKLLSWWTRHDLFVKFGMQATGPESHMSLGVPSAIHRLTLPLTLRDLDVFNLPNLT